MARLNKVQQRAIVELNAITGGNVSPAQAATRSIESLQSAIGWDGFRLFGVDSRTLLINRLLAASDNDGWARREWLEEIYLVDDALPYIQLPNILRAGIKSVAYQEEQRSSWGFPSHLLENISPLDHWHYYHESRSPSGGVLMAGFAHNGRWIAALQAYRRDPGAPFTRADVDFLRRAGSLIGSTLDRALDRERILALQANEVSGLPAATGVALLDANGSIQFATPAGKAWIDLIGADEQVRAGLLPTPLWSAMLGLRRQAGFDGSHTVQTMTSAGPVTLEASPADADGNVAIVINRSRSTSPGIPDSWPLTDQQRQVALRLVAGRTNRQIAGELHISENTVEWHIRHVFARLDVRSRSELTARYFRESALPAYQDPDLESRE